MLNPDFKSPYSPGNFYSLFNSFFSNAGGHPKGLPYDLGGILEAQRKNLKAITDAQEIAMEGFQSIARQQSEFVSSMIANQSSLMGLLTKEGTPEEKIARHADLARMQYNAAIHDIRQMQDTMHKIIRNAADVLHHNVASHMKDGHRLKDRHLPAANNQEKAHGKIAA